MLVAGRGPEPLQPERGSAGDTASAAAAWESQSPRAWSPRQDAVLTAVTEWEARNARAQREREARALQEQDHEQLLTYTREDAYSAVRGAGPGAGRCASPGPWLQVSASRGLFSECGQGDVITDAG